MRPTATPRHRVVGGDNNDRVLGNAVENHVEKYILRMEFMCVQKYSHNKMSRCSPMNLTYLEPRKSQIGRKICLGLVPMEIPIDRLKRPALP